ncbi:MAG: Serine/threonine protein phosphatase [Pseudomonadota bacterium]
MLSRRQKAKNPKCDKHLGFHLAEKGGFEPPIRYNRMPDFESGAFDHSATSPGVHRGLFGEALYYSIVSGFGQRFLRWWMIGALSR